MLAKKYVSNPSAAVSMPHKFVRAKAQQAEHLSTPFMQKLYSMFDDQSIQHLISWSKSGTSILVSPSEDVTKVLSQYFHHTNFSSFVRQLNKNGFHKARGVFLSGSPESSLWEFIHPTAISNNATRLDFQRANRENLPKGSPFQTHHL
jgi:hypothetical protein